MPKYNLKFQIKNYEKKQLKHMVLLIYNIYLPLQSQNSSLLRVVLKPESNLLWDTGCKAEIHPGVGDAGKHIVVYVTQAQN